MQAILWSTLLAGILDISAAMTARAMMNGISPTRVLQSISSGILGSDAFSGGRSVAALGLLLHFLIMAAIATTFYLASRRMPALTVHWLGYGLAFGLLVYLTMSFAVVPLSAYPGTLVPSGAAFIQGAIVHMVCVGLPIAFVTSRWPPAG